MTQDEEKLCDIISKKNKDEKNTEIIKINDNPIKAVIKKGKLSDIIFGKKDNYQNSNDKENYQESNDKENCQESNESEKQDISDYMSEEAACVLIIPNEWFQDLDNVDKEFDHNDNYQDKYDKLKNIINDRDVYIRDILELDIDEENGADLLEKYAIMRTLEPDTANFIKYRNNFKKEIKKYSQNNSLKKELDNFLRKNDESLEEKILELKTDIKNKSLIYKRYKTLLSTNKGDHEYNKLSDWINCVIDIPYNKIKILNYENLPIDIYLNNILSQFNQHLYGMKTVKEELLLTINKKLISPNSSNNIIGLLGSPGVGKTEIVRLLSKTLNLPFEQISLGGLDDVTVLDGYSYTYEGSKCGRILSTIKRMECLNGIIFFDELDKIPKNNGGQAVSNLLIHITDFTQNHDFRDRYLQEISIDLSKIWFIFAMNDLSNIDKVLRDRLKIIHVKGYNKEDKINILKNNFFPQAIKEVMLNKDDIILTSEVLEYIVDLDNREKYTKGLRSLKFKVDDIIKKISILKNSKNLLELSFKIDNFKLPITLNKKIIDKLITINQNDYHPMYI